MNGKAMEKEVIEDLFEAVRSRLPEGSAFVLVVISKGRTGSYDNGGEVISNIAGGEAVANVLHAVAEEQKSGRFFDEEPI
jgi:hypothetical protein